MKVVEKIQKLREFMEKENIDAYIIPSADNHQSEYVGEYFKSRAYMSGFTGSAGTLIVSKTDAGLWTDGRYFLQAEKQLDKSGIDLYRMGEIDVPTIEEYLDSRIPQNGVLGFDGRVISAGEGKAYEEKLKYKNVSIKYDKDFIDDIWEDRPNLSENKAFLLSEKYSGESVNSKLTRLREDMKKNDATLHIITSLDDIAWLLNVRGDDIEYSPLVLSYAVVTMNKVDLFVDENKLTDDIKNMFNKENIVVHPYDDVYEFVKNIGKDEVILLDPKKINYAILNNIDKEIKVIQKPNPTILYKAIKNEIELDNIRQSHIKDGVAVAKFMYWLKQNVGKKEITEIDASDRLREFRAEQEGFISESFAPISAYKENAAIVHYSATEESKAVLKPEHLYLVDTGGNYLEGTTDITRTISLGEIDKEIRVHYTAVLRSMINLSMAKFLHGVKGFNLDILARQPMWDLEIDYKHGTGHGVGYLLNVHEGPAGFRWQVLPNRDESSVIEEGMIITNEPGIYIQGSHGIRIENELIVRQGVKNEFGQFMYFEPVTFAPIDLDVVLVEELTQKERKYLNEYHKAVYNKISPFLNEEEKQWLKVNTREV